MASKAPFVVEAEGLEEIQEALEKFPKKWRSSANRMMKPGLAILESEVKQTARHDLGQTAASVGSEVVRGMGSEIIGKTGSSLAHASYVLEHGRLPGTAPPADVMEEWAGRHGMAGAGFVIARAIGMRGVSKSKTMTKAVQKKGRQVVKEIEKGIERMLRELRLKP